VKPIDALKRFILAKSDEATPEALAEIRAYAEENAEELAPAFGLEAAKYQASIEREGDDAKLRTGLLAAIKSAKKKGSEARANALGVAAQKAADAVGAAAAWNGESADIDLGALLGALSGRGDVVSFVGDGWAATVPQEPLFRLKALRLDDAWAFVDAKGLHVRWGSKGCLNLVAAKSAPGWPVVVNLPARAAKEAA
jgi:hypothetical protein